MTMRLVPLFLMVAFVFSEYQAFAKCSSIFLDMPKQPLMVLLENRVILVGYPIPGIPKKDDPAGLLESYFFATVDGYKLPENGEVKNIQVLFKALSEDSRRLVLYKINVDFARLTHPREERHTFPKESQLGKLSEYFAFSAIGATSKINETSFEPELFTRKLA